MDKKLTDNEIIKALECCSKKICKQCPNFSEDIECSEKLINLTLDYIARQLHELQERYEEAQMEIERLKKEKDEYAYLYEKHINTAFSHIKAEAYKEFAERSEKELFIKQNEHREHWMETLNRHRGTEAYKDYEWSIDNWLRGYGEAVQDILAINQNFLKELEGEDDG